MTGSNSTPSGAAGPAPVVAIVGRPNVGKSTLFNRLVGKRQAIVHDKPGVTRDRLFGTVELSDGGRIELVDTGGLVPDDDPLGMNAQVRLAIDESDLLLFVVDGKTGPTPADERILQELRGSGKAIILVVSKGDTRVAVDQFDEFYAFGVWPQLLLSAEHNVGTHDLLRAIEEEVEVGEVAPFDGPRIAIVGRPNVGKSSLLNRLAGSERTLVSEIAGTTRDPIDTVLELADGRRYLMVDTAGIRRRSQMSDTPESVAVMMARRQIGQADLALLVIDAAQGVTTGDLAIAGSIWELGKAAAVVINKWDLLDEDKREELELGWERLDELLSNPPRFNVSALTGRRVDRVFSGLDPLLERFRIEVSTSELNRVMEQIVERHPAPAGKGSRGKPWRLLYSTQVSTGPPTFMLFANRSLDRSDSYRRYLQNRLRERFELDGVPIRLVIRRRSE